MKKVKSKSLTKLSKNVSLVTYIINIERDTTHILFLG